MATLRAGYLRMAGGGLAVAYSGSITRPAEIRTDDEGKPWIFFSTVADGVRLADEAAARIRVAYFADDAEAIAPRLLKTAEVYVEGRLSIGAAKGGLSVVATRVEVLA